MPQLVQNSVSSHYTDQEEWPYHSSSASVTLVASSVPDIVEDIFSSSMT